MTTVKPLIESKWNVEDEKDLCGFVIFREEETDNIKKILYEFPDKYVQKEFRFGTITEIKKAPHSKRHTLYDPETGFYSIFDINTTIDMPKVHGIDVSEKVLSESHRFEEDMFNALPLNKKYMDELYLELCESSKVKPLKTKKIKDKEKFLNNPWMNPRALMSS